MQIVNHDVKITPIGRGRLRIQHSFNSGYPKLFAISKSRHFVSLAVETSCYAIMTPFSSTLSYMPMKGIRKGNKKTQT